ncbi:GNAT family N-acetyltransferase [Humibacter sp.]|uniref:GNAT family N-acetyltransferase n=1 Tax=Humibacter sp. TaxID=1940291 RepID=UPI002CBE6D4B|nr:GNAT family N-acetyltransferase [Humibacter sp.]HVX07978.1 GNAT family N-acetyltransferase [Humibacter sp.]
MVELIGERVRLRELLVSDVALIHPGASDPRVVRYMSWGPNDEAATRAFVERSIAAQSLDPRPQYALLIEALADGRFLGMTGFDPVPNEPGHATMGYWIEPDEWGNGYATEAAKLVVRHASSDAGITRLTAAASVDNPASHRVLEKGGLTRVGPGTFTHENGTVLEAVLFERRA